MDIKLLPPQSRCLVDCKVLSKLKSNPALINSLTDYITEVEKLLQLPFTVIGVTTAYIAAGHRLRRTHGLFVNDSINLACAHRLGLADIVTHAADFSRISGITAWEPTDI